MRKTAYELRISAWSSDVCFPISERAACLERAADLMIEQMPRLIAFCQREAGKALSDGIAEVREAVDFLRYYAARGRADFGAPLPLPGPTGERNEIRSEEHTSELQSLMRISYAVFCLKKKKTKSWSIATVS